MRAFCEPYVKISLAQIALLIQILAIIYIINCLGKRMKDRPRRHDSIDRHIPYILYVRLRFEFEIFHLFISRDKFLIINLFDILKKSKVLVY
jgi:hypothetical protein